MPSDYGSQKRLIFNNLMRSSSSKYEIVQNLSLNEFSKGKIAVTENELKEGRAMVAVLLPK
jgi:malate dehydrogenase